MPSFHFHARGGKQGEGERERERERDERERERDEREKDSGGVRIRVSVCAFKRVCTCVFARMLHAVNILEIQRDGRGDTDSTHLLQKKLANIQMLERICH